VSDRVVRIYMLAAAVRVSAKSVSVAAFVLGVDINTNTLSADVDSVFFFIN
jgi:hypothetical protein